MDRRRINQWMMVALFFSCSGCTSCYQAQECEATTACESVYGPEEVHALMQIKQSVQESLAQAFEAWTSKAGYNLERQGKPRLIVSQWKDCTPFNLVDAQWQNLLDQVSQEDGRYHLLMAPINDEADFVYLHPYLTDDPYYSNVSSLAEPNKALQCFVNLELQGNHKLKLSLLDIQSLEPVGL